MNDEYIKCGSDSKNREWEWDLFYDTYKVTEKKVNGNRYVVAKRKVDSICVYIL